MPLKLDNVMILTPFILNAIEYIYGFEIGQLMQNVNIIFVYGMRAMILQPIHTLYMLIMLMH